MGESKTIREVLEDVLKILNDIKVPMSEIDNIGIPVARSINGIKACLEAMTENDIKEFYEPEIAGTEKPEQDSGIVIEQ